jgi:hypothetical protein
VKGIKGRLNRLPSACVGDMVMATEERKAWSEEEGHAICRCEAAQAMAPKLWCLHVVWKYCCLYKTCEIKKVMPAVVGNVLASLWVLLLFVWLAGHHSRSS